MPGRQGPKDSFGNFQPLLGDPAGRWIAVSASDSSDLPFVSKALYVGNTGNVTVQDMYDNTTTIPNVPAGSILPGRFKRLMNTNTSASGFVLITD